MAERPRMTIPAALEPFARSVALGDGLRLHYYDAGEPDAPALLLLHGLGDEADTWRRVIAPLSRRWRVIAPDLPGFGRSSKPRFGYGLPLFVRSAAGLLDALGLRRATLVGSSLGAAVAQLVALGAPERVERLVLVGGGLGSGGRASPRTLLFLVPLLGETVYSGLRRSQDAAYAALGRYYADIAALPAEERAFIRARVWARVWDDGQRRAYLSTLRSLALASLRGGPGPLVPLRALPTPTLLLWGERDAVVPVAGAERMLTLLPSARLERIASCGHLPQQECPDAVVAAIERFAGREPEGRALGTSASQPEGRA